MTTADEKAKAAQWQREYRAANRERISEQRRAKYHGRIEEMRQRGLSRYRANHDKIRAQAAARYAAKPKAAIVRTDEEKKAHRDYMREYARQNKERLNGIRRPRHLANPEVQRAQGRKRYSAERMREWARRNRHKIAQYNAERRARLAGATVEKVSVEAIYERDKGLCGICLEFVAPAKFSLDHIIPLAKGGLHMAANLQTAHRSCNSRKGARLLTVAA